MVVVVDFDIKTAQTDDFMELISTLVDVANFGMKVLTSKRFPCRDWGSALPKEEISLAGR